MPSSTKKPSLSPDFFVKNRQNLKKEFEGSYPIVLTANGLLQSSSDNAFAFRQDSNFWYFTGINEPGVILVIDNEDQYLILPPRDKYKVIFEGAVDEKQLKSVSGIKTILDSETGWAKLAISLKGVKRVATIKPPQDFVPRLQLYTNPARNALVKRMKEQNPKLKLVDLGKIVANLRMIKDQDEIEVLNYAINNTSKLIKQINKKLGSYTYEYQVLADIQYFAILNQLELGYSPVIASDGNAVILHYAKSSGALKNSLLIDVGLSYQGYTADLTRTLIRKPTKRQYQVLQAVSEIHNFALGVLKPGIAIGYYEKEVRQFAYQKMVELGLIRGQKSKKSVEYFPHSTSHFLGLDVHDVGDYTTPITPGMVLTVEPGLYIKKENIGVRIEDNVLITKTGNKNLSKQLPLILS